MLGLTTTYSQESHDSTSLQSPFIYSSFNGGISTSETHNIHYQNINGACNTLLYQYNNKVEIGMSHLMRSTEGFALWSKYHINFGKHLVLSPSFLALPAHKYFDRGADKYLKFYPGGQVAGIWNGFRISGSYYKLREERNSEISENAFLFEEHAIDHLYSIQVAFTIDRSILNIEFFSFQSENVMDRTRLLEQRNINITWSYQISKKFSGEIGYWRRLNNHQGYCDLVCIEGFPRVGFSFKLL